MSNVKLYQICNSCWRNSNFIQNWLTLLQFFIPYTFTFLSINFRLASLLPHEICTQHTHTYKKIFRIINWILIPNVSHVTPFNNQPLRRKNKKHQAVSRRPETFPCKEKTTRKLSNSRITINMQLEKLFLRHLQRLGSTSIRCQTYLNYHL